MPTLRGSVPGALLLLLAVAARGGPLPEEELRAEAHRTVLRRLSEGARTPIPGLTRSGREFLDLFLDLARNEADFSRGRMPASSRFHGPAHGVTRVESGALVLEARFVNLVIDRVEVPLTEIPAVLESALVGEVFCRAALASDGEAFEAWRLDLLATVAAASDPALSKTEGWPGLRDRVVKALLAAVSSGPAAPAPLALRCLRTIGDDRAAQALIARAEERLRAGARREAEALWRTALAMDTPTARKKARAVLHGPDAALAAIALRSLGRDLDAETHGFVEELVAPDAGTPPELRRAAIHAIEIRRTDRARAVLLRLFEKAGSEDERYGLACALTRAGSDEAVPYLRGKLEAFERSGRIQDIVRARVVRTLLENLAAAGEVR